MFNRIFVIVLDSLGIGEANDAAEYNDIGSNTLGHIIKDKNYDLNILEKLGLLNLVRKENKTHAYYMKCNPINTGKDSLSGHYEMMGIKLHKSFNTFPNGFPLELISEIQHVTGKEVIGNVASSGSEIINELGQMHEKTKAIIIYTSADSVLQVAAHENFISVSELYDICKKIREIVSKPEYNIGRVIARPFNGKNGNYNRTADRKDFVIDPPKNVLDILDKNSIKTISIGKIGDMFNERGLSVSLKTRNNLDGMMKLVDISKSNFKGLCFANLNDFDSLYGHRRDKDNYLRSLEEFNFYLPILLKNIKKEDLLLITADHGNDPTFKGTDHTREKLPIIMYSPSLKNTGLLKERNTLADIGATILDNFKLNNEFEIGESILKDME